ncbi:MAG: alpha/beta fold hydrolase [Myxococcales bacterium]|nr:alpha/beta fold hydrolase [Myxococcales bacterium]
MTQATAASLRHVMLAALLSCSADAPAPPPPLGFTPCADPLECADVTVPLDWSAPGGAKITLRVGRARALDGEAAGVVFLNPGGPGAPMVERFAAQYGTYRVGFGKALARFDVVTWDVRGAGLSTRLPCVDDTTLDQLRAADLALEGASTAGVEALAGALRVGCQKSALAGHLDLATQARDLEAIRKALGVERVAFLGYSYGGMLGLAYASLFPEHTGAMILDSPTALGPDLEADLTGVAEARAQGLERFFAACAASATCAFGGADPGAVASRFDALVARTTTAKLPAGTRSLSRTDLGFAIADGLRVGDAVKLGADLAKAEAGDASALLARADLATGRDAAGHYDGTFGVHVAIVCGDQRLSAASLSAFASFGASLRARLPRTGWMALSPWSLCVGWSAPPRPEFKGDRAPPPLVVAGRFDPITPFRNAEAMRSLLGPSTQLLVYEGDGHSASVHSACVRDAITGFLIDPKLPVRASCPKE